MSLLLVGNDDFDLETLRIPLAQCGEFQVLKTGSGSAALRAMDEAKVDLVICDTESMSEADLAAVRKSAAEHSAECLFILGGASEAGGSPGSISHSGLEPRAAKPLSIRELVGQIRSLLGKAARQSSSGARFGAFEFVHRNTLRRLDDGSEIFLTGKEAKLLKLLSSAAGGFATSRELMADIWGYHESTTSHTLQTHIYSLRRKLEADPNNPEVLLTEKGGYRVVR